MKFDSIGFCEKEHARLHETEESWWELRGVGDRKQNRGR
jgi:hypothetical protein